MSERLANLRQPFIQYLKARAWEETEPHAASETDDAYYIDAQLLREASTRSLVSLIREHGQILFKAEFDGFVLRLSTTDCAVAHSEGLIDGLPNLERPADVLHLLNGLLTQGVPYTLGIGDGFEPLSADTIGRFAELVF